MERILRRRPSPSMVVALIALFAALSGTAFAVSINSGDIVNNSLKSADLKNGKAVKGIDVKNDALTGADVLESSLAGVIDNVVIRRKDLAPLADASTTGGAGDGSANDGTVLCQGGERAIAGGVRIANAGVDQAISASRPVDAGGLPADGSTAPTGWRGVASDSGSVAGNNPSSVEVFVVCAS